jgi:hypothetical protein
MKRWLLPIFAGVFLWGCSDEPSQTQSTTSASSTSSSSSGNGGAGGGGGTGGEGGGQPNMLRACLDRPDSLPVVPNGTLPCEYIPPGLSLPQ